MGFTWVKNSKRALETKEKRPKSVLAELSHICLLLMWEFLLLLLLLQFFKFLLSASPRTRRPWVNVGLCLILSSFGGSVLYSIMTTGAPRMKSSGNLPALKVNCLGFSMFYDVSMIKTKWVNFLVSFCEIL